MTHATHTEPVEFVGRNRGRPGSGWGFLIAAAVAGAVAVADVSAAFTMRKGR